MNQQKVKSLRKRFEAFFGSKDRKLESYKYQWRLFKKTITRKNWKQMKSNKQFKAMGV